jgi:hypothetical protein
VVRELEATVAQRYGGAAVALTDSGTSALVLALRHFVGAGESVAFPGYACVDLAAAARCAGVRVRLYDLEPETLAPDMRSLEAALRRGVRAVVVVHLYGYPVDVAAVSALARRHGAAVIEDAAQGAGGTMRGVRLGAQGDASILSFGRGKGLGGGGGGALVVHHAPEAERFAAARPRSDASPAGWRVVAASAVQWMLGRPQLYAIPSAMPFLKLGEMVYHSAHEPDAISVASSTLVRDALRHEGAVAARRRQAASVLAGGLRDATGLVPIHAIEGAQPGYLRFAVLDRSGQREPAPRLGVLRGYPRALREQPELAPVLHDGEPATPGALELRASLFTLPTHGLVMNRDLRAAIAWGRRAVELVGSPGASGPRAMGSRAVAPLD